MMQYGRGSNMDVYFILPIFLFLFFSSVKFCPGTCSIYDGDEWSEWSDWSPCSRTCDGGVTQQFRRCKSPQGCHGVSIKRKMCNMQPCREPQDYRGDQCRAFNGIKYEGKRRNWDPYEDPEEPCALICRATGTDIIVRLGPKLRDGTRCRTGSLHVCVNGRCEAVGCDLKIGSPKKIDACGVCGGDNRSCTTPIYRWELESAGPCTVKCGGGSQPVDVVCKNFLTGERVDSFYCNGVMKPRLDIQSCNIQPCEPNWETGEFSSCSKTCGGGLKIRKVFCAQEKNGSKIQVADKLCHHIRRPNNQEPCNTGPCPHWHAGPWSPCSVSCGSGYLTRNVVCRDSSNLPSSKCDHRLKPSDRKACHGEGECPTSSPDRSLTKKRRVMKTTEAELRTTTDLVPIGGVDVDNDMYAEEELPREHTLPLIQPYPPMDNAILFDSNALPSEPTFVAGDWGPCSASCGEGRRTREVKCKIFLEFSRTIANLPDKECPGPKPVESEPCFGPPCHQGDEYGGFFEQLSDIHQAALADSDTSANAHSSNRKPLAVGLPPGISMQDMTYSWKVLGYTPCSASCLGGIQEAMIQCVRDYDQRIATPVLCMDKPQPDIATTRTCNDHPCPPRWNVTEFGTCSKSCGGGVMTREVNCIHEVTRGNTVIVPSSICPSPPPRTTMLCNAVNCPPYWEPGEWGKCSKPCGGGVRRRTIHCKQVNALGQVSDANGHCTGPNKPVETKSCNKKPCSKIARPNSYPSPDDMYPEYKDKVTLAVRGRGVVYYGVSLKLRCPAKKGIEIEKPGITWMKGHEYVKIEPERMEVQHKSGNLKIKNITYSDSGIYTCIYGGRPISNITLMVKPYIGPKDKGRPGKGRTDIHDSTLYADQQEGAVSVSMSHGQIITPPNSKLPDASSSSSALHHSLNSTYYIILHSVLISILIWMRHWLPSFSSGDNEEADSYSSLPKVRSLPSFNEDRAQDYHEDEDELSKVEKLLSKGGEVPSGRIRMPKKDDTDNEETEQEKSVHWGVGEWTECLDSECFNWNAALKRRQVSCEYPNGTTADLVLSLCDPLEKPIEAVECYNPKCLGRWHTQAWSFCKVDKCGAPGIRTRILQCLWYGSGRPAGHACHSLPRPIVLKSCKGAPCTQKDAKNRKMSSRRNNNPPFLHNNNGNPISTGSENNEVMMDLWDLYDQDNND